MCGTRTKLTDMRPDADGHLCTNCYIKMLMQGGREVAQERQAQREHDQRFDTMMYHSEPMDIVARLLKEQKKLFVQGQKTLDGRPAFFPTDFAAEEQRRQAALKEQQAKEKRRQAQIERAKKIGLTPLPRFQQNQE